MKTKLKLLKIYFQQIGVDSEYVSPNLVAEVTYDFGWCLTSDEIIYLSDNL